MRGRRQPVPPLAVGSLHARHTGHQVHAIQEISITYNRKDSLQHRYRIT